MKRSPDRKIKRADANRFERIREDLVTAAAEALAPPDDENAGDQADGDAPRGSDPIVIERQLDEVRNADQHSGYADTVQPFATDLRLQVGGQCLFHRYRRTRRLRG